MKTPIDYVEDIDKMFEECKMEGISRMDQKWGVWSGEMNRETRKRIEEEDTESLKLKYVFVYWQNMSQLLELYFKYGKKMFGKNKIKMKMREAAEIKNVILNGVAVDPLGLDIRSKTSWVEYAAKLTGKLR
jgi:hypothetical protein